ncbi:MAG: hypothetical protein FWD48_00505 [Oscillospiraceae bacterium]|nr:hypothetical protein [Oscillospiraceae bacterium]
MKYDSDNVRFCKSCGTELFFEERFEYEEKEPGFISRLFSRLKNIFTSSPKN